MWAIYTVEFYSAVKNGMDSIIIRIVTQIHIDKSYIFSLIQSLAFSICVYLSECEGYRL